MQIKSLAESIKKLERGQESSATRIRLLEEQLEQKQEMISRLEARLDSQRDYEELKRELLLMKGSSLNDPSINGVDSKDTKEKRPSKISLNHNQQQTQLHKFHLCPINSISFGSGMSNSIIFIIYIR